jgi:release factor glutamine methyltransferase
VNRLIDAASPGQALAIVLGLGRLPDKVDKYTLLAAAAGVERGRLPLLDVEDYTEEVVARYLSYIERRRSGEPVSHILGYREFFNHRFHIGPQVLDPRPETEFLVRAALEKPVMRVLDLGTGSGAIVISILAACPQAWGVGTDLSQEALEVSRDNAGRIGVAERCRFLKSDWFADVGGTFDLIVSNPPYIAAEEMAGLAPELAHEPRMALTDEGDGLGAYRAITKGAPDHLASGGRLMVEIGPTQAQAVSAMFRKAGLADITILTDFDGRDRVVSGKMP